MQGSSPGSKEKRGKPGYFVFFMLSAMVILPSCGAEPEAQFNQMTVVEANEMEVNNTASALKDILGCGLRTAKSLESTMLNAGIPDIVGVDAVDDDIYRIIRITDSSSNNYYVFVGPGYFIEAIHSEAPDGPRIYFAMQ